MLMLNKLYGELVDATKIDPLYIVTLAVPVTFSFELLR
jgi:hypothetical protein